MYFLDGSVSIRAESSESSAFIHEECEASRVMSFSEPQMHYGNAALSVLVQAVVGQHSIKGGDLEVALTFAHGPFVESARNRDPAEEEEMVGHCR
jgi:hypothetical protein